MVSDLKFLLQAMRSVEQYEQRKRTCMGMFYVTLSSHCNHCRSNSSSITITQHCNRRLMSRPTMTRFIGHLGIV